MPFPSPRPLAPLQRRVGPGGRLYAGFIAACALLLFPLVALVLVRAWSVIRDGPFLWALLASAVVAPVAAWCFLRVVITGISPFPVHRPGGQMGELLWAAALGSAGASARLLTIRERLRAELSAALPQDPEHCADLRGVYSMMLADARRILAEVSPANVVPASGTQVDKDTLLERLEAEITIWQADYEWFEQFIDRNTT